MSDRDLTPNPFSLLLRKILRKVEKFRAKGKNDLSEIGGIYRTDKVGEHYYTQHYSSHFERFRDRPVNVLEIGAGGYEAAYSGGNSLRMWRSYFSLAKIYSIDIYDKSPLQEDRIKIFKGSQVDEVFLDNVVNEIGDIDLIIDDGSHVNDHVITTFQLLFPRLKEGGIYVVEDIQTSYWPEYGGDSRNLNNPRTTVNYFKSLIDSLNNQEFLIPGYQKTYFDRKIVSMHFYHNLIFIYKGDNNEVSNIVVNNEMS